MRTRDDLYEYQRRAVQFIKDHDNCALWVEMGLGKTVSTQTAYADMLDSFDVKHGLVIAPLRVARKVWTDETKVWSHLNDLKIVHIGGTPAQRNKALRTRADLHTIGRENTQWLVDQFVDGKKQIRKWPWSTVILDESQSFKSQSSFRWKKLKQVRKLFSRCVELTGTPAPNGYGDLWSQLYLLDRGLRLGTSESAYRDRWFDTEMGDGYCNYYLKPTAAKEIQAAVSDIVLSLRVEDYFDLPPVVYNQVKVSLSPDALKTYKKFERTSIMDLQGRKITAVNAGVAYGKLLQLANGAIYVNEKRDYLIFHEEKTKVLMELLEGCSGPTIIAYSFVSDSQRIAKTLNAFCGSTKKWAVADTDADLERFARGELDFMVMHPASAGHGLNDLHLSGSETIIWFGLTTSHEWFTQLNARLIGGIRRLGKNVVIHIIVAEDTKDEEVFELLKRKEMTEDDLKKALTKRISGDKN